SFATTCRSHWGLSDQAHSTHLQGAPMSSCKGASPVPVDNLWIQFSSVKKRTHCRHAYPTWCGSWAFLTAPVSSQEYCMLRDAIEAERAECDQDADCARINAAIELAKKDFAALGNRELDPEDRQKQWAAIRDQAIFVIRDVRRNIVRRA